MSRPRHDRAVDDGVIERVRAGGERRPHAGDRKTMPADLPPRRPETAGAASLAATVGALNLCLALVHPDGTIGYVSEAFARLLGIAQGRLAHMSLGDAIPRLGTGEPAALLARSLATGEPCKFCLEHGSGSMRRLLALRASRTADGQLALEMSDATDTAGQEQLHRRVLEGSREGLMELDDHWRVTYWNAAAERLTHVGRRTVLGRPLWELWPALCGTVVEEALRATMSDRQPRELSQWHDRPRFGGRVLDMRSVPLHGAGMLIFFNETSARMREQRVLASTVEENALLRELAGRLADTPDSPTLLRVLCDIVLRECAAMGAGVAAVQGGEVEVLAALGGGLQQSGTAFPLAGSLTGVVVATRRLTRRRLDGAAAAEQMAIPDQVGEAMLAPLIGYDQVMGVLAVVRAPGALPFAEHDERRLRLVADHAALALWKSRLLEQALAASEARSNFLATMSHELRTPLTALTGYGELLADEIVGPLGEGQMEMVERMRSVTHELTGMIDELLTFSSLEAGRERLRRCDVACGDLLQAAVAVVEPLARQKGLQVRVSMPASTPSLFTDPEKVRQILVNLAGNAVKFTDRGEVSFLLDGDAAEVRFLVRDTGPGIPPGGQERIFQPFTQLEGGLTRRYGGTGLGLYIASRLAGLLGGRIELASRPGEGSSFALVLPRDGSR